MNMRRLALLAICLIAMPFVADAQRSEQLLERGWRFTRQDCADFKELGYDDSSWQEVVVVDTKRAIDSPIVRHDNLLPRTIVVA